MNAWLHRFVLRPMVRWVTGIRVAGPGRLPAEGPAIVVANHNSHVDTALLLAAFDAQAVAGVHPVAAADYWFRTPMRAWFSRRVLGAVPVDRSGGTDCLRHVSAILGRGEIVIVFPEGTRGEPGRLGRFRSGVARLATLHPDAVVVPVWLEGTERVLPRHSTWPRRQQCVVIAGEPASIEGMAPREAADDLRRRVVALR
jgi:1-acyl-sn-glycerol-3-phosphate acyltransferase